MKRGLLDCDAAAGGFRTLLRLDLHRMLFFGSVCRSILALTTSGPLTSWASSPSGCLGLLRAGRPDLQKRSGRSGSDVDNGTSLSSDLPDPPWPFHSSAADPSSPTPSSSSPHPLAPVPVRGGAPTLDPEPRARVREGSDTTQRRGRSGKEEGVRVPKGVEEREEQKTEMEGRWKGESGLGEEGREKGSCWSDRGGTAR